MRIDNPGNVNTNLPHIRLRLTPAQTEELANRLVVTAETDELDDWGWIEHTGRTTAYLCIVNNRIDAVTDARELGDLDTVIAITRDWNRPALTAGLERLRDRIDRAVEDMAATT